MHFTLYYNGIAWNDILDHIACKVTGGMAYIVAGVCWRKCVTPQQVPPVAGSSALLGLVDSSQDNAALPPGPILRHERGVGAPHAGHGHRTELPWFFWRGRANPDSPVRQIFTCDGYDARQRCRSLRLGGGSREKSESEVLSIEKKRRHLKGARNVSVVFWMNFCQEKLKGYLQMSPIKDLNPNPNGKLWCTEHFNRATSMFVKLF